MATLKIKQVKSGIDRPERQKRTLKALGFRKMNQIVEQDDNAVIRGMIAKVSHLVEIIN